MKRWLFLCLGAVPAIFVVTPGIAQERPNGLFLTSPLGISSGYDDNYPVGPRLLDDTVTLLTTPTFAWFATTHRTQLSFSYQGEFEMFARNTGQDAWNHSADVRFSHRFNARWSLDGADLFLSTMDPTRRLENSLLMLPRARYNENSFYTRLAYRYDYRTVFSARVDNGYATMDLPETLAERLNRLGTSGTLMMERSLNKHHSISTSYSYLFVHPLEAGIDAVNTSSHIIAAGYTYTPNPGLVLRATGGVTKTRDTSFTGTAAVDKKFGDAWVSLGYQRYLGFYGVLPASGTPIGPILSGAAVAPDAIYQVIALRTWGNITRRIGLEGTVQRALNGVTTENRGIKSIIAQLRVSYKINDRVTAFTQTEFFGQNISEFLPYPLSRRRYFAGLEFTLTRPPELTEDPRRHKPLSPSERDDRVPDTDHPRPDDRDHREDR